MILDEKLAMSWICSVKVGTVDRELLALMHEAGCHMIRIGVETGNQELLDNVKKGVRIEEVEQTVAWCHEVGMEVHAHMMLGMPGETHETVRKSFRFVEKIRPTTVTYGITTPYPGTPLYDDVVEKFPELGDGSQIDVRSIHTNGRANEFYTQLSAKDLSGYVREAYRRFYLRPGYILSQLKRVTNKEDLRRLTIAGANVFDFVLRGDEG
ncbi:MAG: radical SAM protein [Planctomycetes bacterium]|nr:radical SAM protein [Planctomycetota bacterium]